MTALDPKITSEMAYHNCIDTIAKAIDQNRRKAEDVQLIAVSKTYGVKDIDPFLQLGHRIFGENRVQEAQEKWPSLKEKYSDLQLHLIGPLQSNKARQAVALFDSIHTIDREKIAIEVQKEMEKQNRKLELLVQVNIGEESQKSGIEPLKLTEFITWLQEDVGLDIAGLMCIPPFDEPPGAYFALLQKYTIELSLKKLSMGMSADYPTAIRFGAHYIRVGSALFGQRN